MLQSSSCRTSRRPECHFVCLSLFFFRASPSASPGRRPAFHRTRSRDRNRALPPNPSAFRFSGLSPDGRHKARGPQTQSRIRAGHGVRGIISPLHGDRVSLPRHGIGRFPSHALEPRVASAIRARGDLRVGDSRRRFFFECPYAAAFKSKPRGLPRRCGRRFLAVGRPTRSRSSRNTGGHCPSPYPSE